MYKVVLADDEPKICQLILELGDWKRFGIEVAAVCHDGEDAYESILRVRPDIVLTDVRMPVYDGLELIRRVTEAGLHPAFIVISGYKYFDYAYSAFKYGVIDYLLKPIDQVQMNEVLEKTCRMIEKQKVLRQAENELQRLNERMELSGRKQMFRDLLDPEKDFPATAEELDARYRKKFVHSCLRVFFLRTNRSLEAENSELLVQKLKENLQKVLQDAAGKEAAKPCLETVHDGLACILDFEPDDAETLYSRLTSFLYDARELSGLFGNTWVVIGLSPVLAASDLAALPGAARAAEEAAAARIILGGNRIIEPENIRFSRIGMEQILGEGGQKSLQNALETLSPELYTEILERLLERSDIQPPLRPEVLERLTDTILKAFETYAGGQPEDIRWEEVRQEWLQETGQCVGIREYFRVMEERGIHCIEEWKALKLNREKLPIRLAKAWIEEHYGEAASLETVAEEVGLSPAYFSTSFRQVEGRTFSDYLTAVRMQAAREFLSETRMTNGEIAEKIGYKDEKYFGKVFKKEVGIRPGEYRKLYQKR